MSHFTKERIANKCQTFAGSSFLNVRIFCFSLSFVIANKKSFGFELKVLYKRNNSKKSIWFSRKVCRR